jgi:C-1 hydroxylase
MRRVWNEQDLGAMDEWMSPDPIAHGLGEQPTVGPEAWRQFRMAFGAAFDNIRIDVADQVVDGDMAAVRIHATMTHKQKGMPVEIGGMILVRVKDGRIVEGWNAIDFLPMLARLRLVRADVMPLALGISAASA